MPPQFVHEIDLGTRSRCDINKKFSSSKMLLADIVVLLGSSVSCSAGFLLSQ